MMRKVWSVLAATLSLVACASLAQTAEIRTMPGQILMDGQRLHPESITSDAAHNIYVGTNPGFVFRAMAGSPIARAWIGPNAENGLKTVFGVLVDEPRGLLWVCSNDMAPDGGGPAIKTFSLTDAHFVASYPFAVEDAAMCNDMTVAPNGDVYASETLGGRIMLLRDGGTAFETWATDPEFASLDGISFGPGGRLFANAIQRNTLLEVHRNADGSFARAEVLETTQPLSGPDGLRPLDDTRMLQSEGNAGTITVLTFTEGQPVEVQVIAEGIDYASSVTVANGRAYYPEGKLRFLFGPNAGEDPGRFMIRSAEIPRPR